MKHLSIRSLAGAVFRQGDLYPSRQGPPVEAKEGVQTAARVQAMRCRGNPFYRAEVTLSANLELANTAYALQGRADGLALTPEGELLIEEYKTTRAPSPLLNSVDQAQVRLYAGLYLASQGALETVGQITLRLLYLNPETLQEHVFEDHWTPEQAAAYLALALTCYQGLLEAKQRQWLDRETWAEALRFPYSDFRINQRAVSRRVFRSLSKGENLLLEAPTGSGKTLAVLYPAIKVQRGDRQLVYLTSKSRGADTVAETLTLLNIQGPKSVAFNATQITAKAKVCLMPGMPCDAALCPYARGYYDRVTEALSELLTGGYIHEQRIHQIALKHQLCPFELSLDAASESDLIVADYNYVFDPAVRLQRLGDLSQHHLLVDEAHQLPSRVQSMLSTALSLQAVAQALRTCALDLAPAIRRLQRALAQLTKAAAMRAIPPEQVEDLEAGLQAYVEAVDHWRTQSEEAHEQQTLVLQDARDEDPVQALYFISLGWMRSKSWGPSDSFRYLLRGQGDERAVVRYCVDPGPYTADVLKDAASVLRFSGTVSPLGLYQQLHGFPEQLIQSEGSNEKWPTPERAPNPFQASSTGVLLISDIPTYLRTREGSLPRLAALVQEVIRTAPGRYLIALPSYAYLELFSRTQVDAEYGFMVQRPNMSDGEQADLLSTFADQSTCLLGVVLGGVLTESLNFPASGLRGVFVVGLGLPPPGLERDLMAAHFDEKIGKGWGQQVAYTQPAMLKVSQAAGRLIRRTGDRGLVFLIDPRFAEPRYRCFLPAHWMIEPTALGDVRNRVKTFWAHDSPS